jgi:hypothetical protein
MFINDYTVSDNGEFSIIFNALCNVTQIIKNNDYYQLYKKCEILRKFMNIKKCSYDAINDQVTLIERKLNYLPIELNLFHNLCYFDGMVNNIKIFPTELCDFPKLIKLNLESNKLNSIPSEIGKLVNLEVFCLPTIN